MLFYYGRNYEATRAGRSIRRVVCEKCRTEYFYELVRIGTGTEESPYGLMNSTAQRTATATANRELQDMLTYCHDPVACPECGLIQKKMRWQAAVTRARRWMINAVVANIVLIFVATIVLLGMRIPAWGWWYYWGLVACIVLFTYRIYVAKRQYDEECFRRIPESDINLLAPPALVPTSSSDGGFVLVPAKATTPRHVGSTLVEQFIRLGLPPFCFRCLARTDHRYKPPITVSGEQPTLPCCETCSRLLSRRVISIAFWSWIAQAIAIWSLTRWNGLDVFGQCFSTIAYSILPGSILSVTLGNSFGVAARLRDIDAWRGWGSLRTTDGVMSQLVAYYSQPEVHSVRLDEGELAKLRGEV